MPDQMRRCWIVGLIFLVGFLNVMPASQATANDCRTVDNLTGWLETCVGGSNIDVQADVDGATGYSDPVDSTGIAWDGATPYCGPDTGELLAALTQPAGLIPVCPASTRLANQHQQ